MADTFSPCPSCHAVNRIAVPSASGRQPVCARCKTPLRLHGAVSEVDGQGLESLLRSSSRPVLADFWAPWCGPCRGFAPIFEEAAQRLAGEVVLAKLDTEADPQTSARLGIRAIPTLVLYRGGQEAKRQPGAMSLEQLLGWVLGAA